MTPTRRTTLLAALGLSAVPLSAAQAASPKKARPDSKKWGSTFDNQRKGDLGNGYFQNPILAGDHPDPSILKDGDVYYHVASSFIYYPGLVIWKSYDLVNWTCVGPALTTPVGSVYAPDIIKHEGRYYIYFPAKSVPQQPKSKFIMTNYVVYADKIEGPWSEPIDFGVYDAIDPGHVVGEDGKRYVYVSDGMMSQMSDDGLSLVGKKVKAYNGWKYPEDWSVETFALEGPKFLWRGDWLYMFSAEGGTAGPPTSHMVVAARSKSVHGPWENSPYNPVVHTQSAAEPWWSRGHGTVVEGPSGDWWMVYHGYENGFRPLGRQMLLEPITWTADGWPVAKGGDLSQPLKKPVGGKAVPHGVKISGTLDQASFGARYAFFKPGPDYMNRVTFDQGTMILKGQGKNPADTSPLLVNAGDHAYELTAQVELEGDVAAGVVLYYNEKMYAGMGCNGQRFLRYQLGNDVFSSTKTPAVPAEKFYLKVRNKDNVGDFYYSLDGKNWVLMASFEVSGYHHNMAGLYLSLRPGIYATGSGAIKIRNLIYTAL